MAVFIKFVKAREVFDSRGDPTLEPDLSCFQTARVSCIFQAMRSMIDQKY